MLRRLLPAAMILLALAAPSLAARPNVVLILTDNQGQWTLGCYGNRDIRTPNIDRLASQGIRFTRCFSSNAVCSPTRATLLTGLIPSQHGVHCYLAGGRLQVGPDARNTLAEFRSLPEILKDEGYVCGLSGKWHLGDNLHPQEGFTDWVTKPAGHTSTFYDWDLIEDGKIRKEPQYCTDFWTEHGIRFLRANKDRPFFLFLAYNGPYGLGRSLLEPARNRWAAYYADKQLPCFPREEVHPWLFNNRDYINNIQAMRRYAAEVSGVDDGVGRVLRTLSELGLEKNTLVVFTADQGLAGGQSGYWGMGDHSRPLTAFDTTMQVPLIWRHPPGIPAGKTCEAMVSNYDFLPTVLSYLGLADKMPKKPQSPGRDYSPALRGEKLPDWENVIYYEFENTRAIRTETWKLVIRFPDGPHELYNLKDDPGERTNLVDRPEQVGRVQDLRKRLDTFFNRYADPRYDLAHGGGSQTHLITQRKEKK